MILSSIALVNHYQTKILLDIPFPTVNTCLAVRLPEPADWDYTITYAHKNGDVRYTIEEQTHLGILRLYDYNRREALEDFKTPSNAMILTTERLNGSNHCIYGTSAADMLRGNALGFLEPLESFAGAYYDKVSDECRICVGDICMCMGQMN